MKRRKGEEVILSAMIRATVLMLSMVFLSPFPLFAQESIQKVVVRVDGLACPFCDFGLSKLLKKLEGVENVELDLNEGIAELLLKPGATVSNEEIKRAVDLAGFTAPKDRDITHVAAKKSSE